MDCENIFNLTPPEATQLIELFREEVATEPNLKPGTYSDMDIEVTIKSLNDNLYTATISSCGDIESFHEINKTNTIPFLDVK